mmetsp:Transcript_2921/g.1912  ORF Transcript_2921/g.1912 Transcript_2921/m.1912 type:complete len:99 (+) Transcript_2921:474-770(+)|eukprot:CAMPEP_0116878348 /NCGR_PEP_ID=MMETSP0463-20121206/10095_1 /TAXON_ID=181622 /ORGANISM="Strombidinopsis sp, Strain SopsisLIS2011" /LENGTH=98 /DNA_ID=CAMNT_0004526473 /DNA_START=428 /DNA_END=724 /DNA_ORIENTATION=-
MEKADKDGSGTIELNEFLSLMAEKINSRSPEEELMKAFHMYHDDDDKHTISYNNLRKVADDLGENVTDEEVYAMIAEADTKDSNEVDIDDFMNLMQNM